MTNLEKLLEAILAEEPEAGPLELRAEESRISKVIWAGLSGESGAGGPELDREAPGLSFGVAPLSTKESGGADTLASCPFVADWDIDQETLFNIACLLDGFGSAVFSENEALAKQGRAGRARLVKNRRNILNTIKILEELPECGDLDSALGFGRPPLPLITFHKSERGMTDVYISLPAEEEKDDSHITLAKISNRLEYIVKAHDRQLAGEIPPAVKLRRGELLRFLLHHLVRELAGPMNEANARAVGEVAGAKLPNYIAPLPKAVLAEVIEEAMAAYDKAAESPVFSLSAATILRQINAKKKT
jgi:hypothetical protein